MESNRLQRLKINFFELDRRDPVDDFEEIKWMVDYKTKTLGRSVVNNALMILKEMHWDRFKEMKAFEMMELITTRIEEKELKKYNKKRSEQKERMKEDLKRSREMATLDWNKKTLAFFKAHLCLN